jgi:hypothetical protein
MPQLLHGIEFAASVWHNARMAKKKPKPDEEPAIPPATASPPRSRDRHKARKTISLEPGLYAHLQALADRNDRPLAREVRRILIDHLKREGLWPPPDETTSPSGTEPGE